MTTCNTNLVNFDRIKQITECSICLEAMKKPKCLPCLHTFCLECLKQHRAAIEDREQIACPLCREEFVIPVGGFEMLKNNIFILNLLTCNINDTEAESHSLVCQMCEEEDSSDNPVTKYCVECEKNICERCVKIHGNIKATHSHKVVSSDDKQQISVLIRSRPVDCEIHENTPLSLYCCDCKQVICLMCNATDHRGHVCSDFKKAIENFTAKLNKFSPCLVECVDVIKEQIKKTNDFKDVFFTGDIKVK